MADKKGPMLTANKLAMSKALGAAFLNHQVEQLEKTVSGKDNGGWRDRKFGPPQANADYARGPNNRRPPAGAGAGPKAARKGADVGGADERRKREGTSDEKDADIVVVDASVLVHALPHVKKWCRDGRQEIVIVPLEALNTLDLLKKGTSALAQRARTASRLLEAQVGTNPRIRVQRDDAFVPWDSIAFSDTSSLPQAPSPEWVRRTICCARWESEHAASETAKPKADPKVVFAVLSGTPEPLSDGPASTGAISASPVPLPAPQPNKYEPRATGTMVLQWASRAGLNIMEVAPTPVQGGKDGHANGARRSAEQGRRSPEDDRNIRGGGGGGRGRRNSHHQRTDVRGPANGGAGLVERPPAVMAMMEAVSQPSRVVRVLARGEKLDPN